MVDESVVLNEIGKIVESEWVKTAEIRDSVFTDAYMVMPNHFHGILFIGETPGVGATGPVAPTKSGTLQPGNNWTI